MGGKRMKYISSEKVIKYYFSFTDSCSICKWCKCHWTLYCDAWFYSHELFSWISMKIRKLLYLVCVARFLHWELSGGFLWEAAPMSNKTNARHLQAEPTASQGWAYEEWWQHLWDKRARKGKETAARRDEWKCVRATALQTPRSVEREVEEVLQGEQGSTDRLWSTSCQSKKCLKEADPVGSPHVWWTHQSPHGLQPCLPVLLWAGAREDQGPEKRGGVGEGVLRFCFYFSFLLCFDWQ